MANFISMVINEDTDLSMIKNFDVVVMNGFIDVLQNPIKIMNNILKNCKRYVIIHRQFLINGSTKITTRESYGGITFQSFINVKEFYDTINSCNMNIQESCYSGLNSMENFSFLLKARGQNA